MRVYVYVLGFLTRGFLYVRLFNILGCLCVGFVLCDFVYVSVFQNVLVCKF